MPRSDPDLIGITRTDRHESDGARPFIEEAQPVAKLTVYKIRQENSPPFLPVGFLLGLHHGGKRRDEGIGIDLPVRMVQRDADFDPAIFKGQDIVDIIATPEFAIAIAPDLEDESDVAQGQSSQT